MVDRSATLAIQDYCRQHAGEMLDLLKTIVNIDSCSPNPRGVDEVAALLRSELRNAGFQTESISPQTSDLDTWIADFFLPEIGSFDYVADHLIGRKAGSGRGHAMLIGHMDTAFPLGEPEHNPFRVEGDRALGCAIADMKSGLVINLYTVKALAAVGAIAPRITMVYDSDEQAGSITARPIIERIVRDEDVTAAFKSEVGRDGGCLVKRRNAIGIALIEVEGIERHVGTGYWDGASAVIALAEKASRLQSLSDRDRGIFVNVGEFHGGTRRNLVAGRAYAKLDVRARTQAEWEATARQIQAIVEQPSIPGTMAKLRLLNHRPAMEPTDKTERLMETVRAASHDLGQEVCFVETGGASDANFPAALGVPTLDGFGAHGANVITRDEYIEIDSLSQRAALLATTLNRLALED